VKQKYNFLIITAVFAFFYFTPFSNYRIPQTILESLLMAQEYAREHVLLCLIPSLVIDGNVKVAGKIPGKKEITEWIEEEKK